MPAETAELLYPIAYEAFEIRKDSAGAGRYRGGLGATFKVRFLCDGELSMETSRTREGSPGVLTDLRSAVQRQTKIRVDGSEEVIGGMTPNGEWRNPLQAGYPFTYGEIFKFDSTGGGGWGDPFERDIEKVCEDVLDEYITVAAARNEYGVVIDPEPLTVDLAATKSLRQSGRPLAMCDKAPMPTAAE